MPRALWAGASGMAAQQTNIDVIANNIANVNTTGFKRQRADFQDLFYQIDSQPGARAGLEGRNPVGTQIGLGVRLAGTPREFSEGNLEQTNVQTDMAIEGDGFFRITKPDGTIAYSRAGDFHLDADGQVVTPDGYFLEPRITIPDQTSQLAVSTTGIVTAIVAGTEQVVGNLTLDRFRNPAGLLAVGRNLFQETEASGPATSAAPGTPGVGSIRQGALEKGNVEVVTELVNLIVAQRSYELNSRSIKTSDEMLRTATQIGE